MAKVVKAVNMVAVAAAEFIIMVAELETNIFVAERAVVVQYELYGATTDSSHQQTQQTCNLRKY
jgi:hypothetical protein